MCEENLNCTVVTALYNIDRENWFYKRPWREYLSYFENTLSLRCKFVIFVDSDLIDFVINIRKKFDPELKYTNIIEKKFNEFPKYYLKERIKNIMESSDFKYGLNDPNPPEYNKPDYIILIHSKMFLVEEAINYNFYNTDYFMWLDGGIRHKKFRNEDIGRLYPNPEKIKDINGIRILCRIPPKESDLNIKQFYKLHQNRFGAGVIVGHKDKIKRFNNKMDEIFTEALDNNLIDSEQSMHAVCYLRNRELFELIYNEDWYYHFDYYKID